jgi:Holliday junction resolvase-like predicted endonuclease
MTYERQVMNSILELTQRGPASKELLRKTTHLDSAFLNKTLAKLFDNGFFQLKQNFIEVSPSQRVNLAFRVIMLGGDLERTCRLLKWAEFEGVAAEALQINGFVVLRNFRFKRKGKRWEMDVIGFREPLVVCIDCKHWRRRLTQAALVKVVEAQLERTREFADVLPSYWTKTRLNDWKTALIVPVILSLVSGSLKFYNNVPIVSILQLRDFINTLPCEAHLLTHFSKQSLHREQKLTDYCR